MNSTTHPCYWWSLQQGGEVTRVHESKQESRAVYGFRDLPPSLEEAVGDRSIPTQLR